MISIALCSPWLQGVWVANFGLTACRARGHRLGGVMRTAEALAIGRIVAGAVVADFADVVGEHAVAGLGLGAAPAIGGDRFASAASPGDHSLAPSTIGGRKVERVGLLGWGRNRSAIELGDKR